MSGRKVPGVVKGLGLLVSLFLGGMWLLAALLKAADPGLFIEQIRGYNLLPQLAVLWAYLFIWAEIVLGLLLIFHLLPRPALLGTIGLMVFFIAVTAWAWAHGHAEACGCFGRLGGRPPKEVIIEDLIYSALAAFAYWVLPWIDRSRIRWGIGLALLPILLASPWFAHRMPIDSLILPLKPGVSLETLAADDLKVPLSKGTVFLAFLGSDCNECQAALPMMAELAKTKGAPRVNGLFSGGRSESRAWILEHVPGFAVASSPEKAMRQYYRKLPVFLLSEDGIIQKVWYNQAPTLEEVMEAASE